MPLAHPDIHRKEISTTRQFWIYLFIVCTTLAVYGQIGGYDFIDLDDDLYITGNPNVQAGFSWKGIWWAFSTTHAANWQPLTWLSHMLDIHLFGMNSGLHHLTNLFFHIINSLLLFAVLRRMTGALWRSAFVAALFALHPLHVESVAWVSERKDVLSTLFWFLTMISYVRYVEDPKFSRYFLVLLCFILGLMSKPMLVTLPFVLLLLDFWPLGRFRLNARAGGDILKKNSGKLFLIVEKIPLFFITGISGIITFFAQKRWGAISNLEIYPLDVRIANALVSYIKYIGKMIWPGGLTLLYPYPRSIHLWQSAGALGVLIIISFGCFRVFNRRPYLSVGWLWYVGTLIPVIGLVQVGSQGLADRYTYIPLIGLFIMIAWGVSDMAVIWEVAKKKLYFAAITVLSIFMAITWMQVGFWQNSVSIFERALNVTEDNFIIHNNLGVVFERQGRHSAAMAHYMEARRIYPAYPRVHNNMGIAMAGQGDLDAAIGHYTRALRLDPGYAEVHNNLGLVLIRKGKIESALRHFKMALSLKPDYVEADKNRKRALLISGKIKTAVDNLKKELLIDPVGLELPAKISILQQRRNALGKAVDYYRKALSPQPGYIRKNFDIANLNGVDELLQDCNDIMALFEKLNAVQADTPDAYYIVAGIYARQQQIEKSVIWLKKAVDSGFDNWIQIKTDKTLENIRATLFFTETLKASDLTK